MVSVRSSVVRKQDGGKGRLIAFLVVALVASLFVLFSSSNRKLVPGTTMATLRGTSSLPTLLIEQQGLTNVTTVGAGGDNSYQQCLPGVVYHPAGFVALESRANGGLGRVMEQRGFTSGAEVGVQRGVHARKMLEQWPGCQSFALIDLWAHQPDKNYLDKANVQQNAQDQIYNEAKQRLQKFRHKTRFYRMASTEAAKMIGNHSLDFIYIDARHDYCGVTEDIEAYWPKLRPGGLMAGHDFMFNSQVRALQPDQDWSICQDGTRNERAVRGAVEDFAKREGLVVTVEFAAGHEFRTWMVQKPTLIHCIQKS